MRRIDPAQRAAQNADFQARRIGGEVLLARTRNGQTRKAVSHAAGVSTSTEQRVEQGDPAVGLQTLCAVCAAVGLEVSVRAFPTRGPQLRDARHLQLAEALRAIAHPSWRVVVEHPIAGGRSADEVLFGPEEIIHVEFYRLAADWQAQQRSSAAKRDELQAHHTRPVRLVLAFEDTDRNRRILADHASLIRHVLPAGSRKILRAVREGTPLGEDGLLWIRPRR